MPAPTEIELFSDLKAAFLSLGPGKVAKRDEQTGAIIPGELPPQVENVCTAIARALSIRWATWQATQTVVGTATGVTSGPSAAPVTGTLP